MTINVNQFKSSERNDFSDFNCHWWRGKPVSNHSHLDYYEIIIITDGIIYNVINGNKHKQIKGTVTLLSPNCSHRLVSDTNAVHYNIAVKKRFFDSLLQNKNALKSALNDRAYLTVELSKTVYDYVYSIITKIQNDNYNAFNYSLVESVLYAVICELFNEVKSIENLSKTAEYCHDAIRQINNGSYISMLATEIYNLYPVSHTAFIKEFKNITGKTLVSYLQSKKLEYAKTLLLTTDYSVLYISSLLNYDSLSYFIRIFKEEYNLTPYKYRKNNTGTVFTD